jgi:hypothetical protein
MLRIIRRYMMEHLKASSQRNCNCSICVDARKLLKDVEGME